MTDLLTLVTAVRDGMPFLTEMMASVRERQPAVRHIVIDDGSRDATPEVLAGLAGAPDVITMPHSVGQAAALNAALGRVKTPWFMIMDADDLLEPGYLAHVLDALSSGPRPDLVYGQAREFGDADARARWTVRDEPCTGYWTSGSVVRTSLAASLGGFDPRIRHGAFVDFRMRAISAGAWELVLPYPAVLRRVHGGNMTIRDAAAGTRDYLAIARAAAARARASS